MGEDKQEEVEMTSRRNLWLHLLKVLLFIAVPTLIAFAIGRMYR